MVSFGVKAAVLAVGLVGVGVGAWYASRPNVPPPIGLSEAERVDAGRVAREFVMTAADWGVREDQVTARNFLLVSGVIAQDAAHASPYWRSRQDVFTSLRPNVLPGSALDYDPDVVAGWDDLIAAEGMVSMFPLSVSVSVPSVAVMTGEGPTVEVQVRYDVRERKRVATASDASWDGTVEVWERVFSDAAQVSLVKSEGDWMVADVVPVAHPFLLASWRDAGADYADSQFGFKRVGSMRVSMPSRF